MWRLPELIGCADAIATRCIVFVTSIAAIDNRVADPTRQDAVVFLQVVVTLVPAGFTHTIRCSNTRMRTHNQRTNTAQLTIYMYVFTQRSTFLVFLLQLMLDNIMNYRHTVIYHSSPL